ncbi:MAG: zinc ABC transporter substrate-binding protein [Pseudomonadota bacterium]
MGDTGQPGLIIEGGESPHVYSLTPSKAQLIADAEVVVWVGEALESFLADRLETLAEGATLVELAEAPDLILHDFREGGAFEGHDHSDHGDHDDHAEHDDHDHDDHAEHDHADHDDHDHDDHAEHDHDDHAEHDDHADHDDHAEHADHDDHAHDDDHAEHADAHDHHHSEHDVHVWLDPKNAELMVAEIQRVLSGVDPANADAYAANAAATITRLGELSDTVAAKLEPVKDVPFIVFHDAYQYFEHRFGLTAAGSITVSPEILPGAKRLVEIKEKLVSENAACVFSEPQFKPDLVDVVTEGTNARTGVLDPLGFDLAPGPDQYFELIEAMAETFHSCLSADS